MQSPQIPGRVGADPNKEVRPSALYRDARTLSQKTWDFLSSWENLSMSVGMACAVGFIFPASMNLALLVGVGLILFGLLHGERLPVRIPISHAGIDPGDPSPGRIKFRKARGIMYMGNDMRTGEEIWAAREDILTHLLLFGTTGAGKTYSLTGIALNFMLMGAGLAYIDAKAVASLAADIFAGACSLGRDDDILVLNFITGNQTIHEKSRVRMSNTANFLRHGAAANLSDLFVSLLSGGDDGGGANSVFRDKAIALMKALMMVLVDLRDAGVITLGPNTLREWMALPRLMSLSNKTRDESGRPNAQVNARLVKAIRPSSMEALNAYLETALGGFLWDKPASQQSETVQDQYGYANMYWTRALGMLSDTYRHIYWTDVGEVDMQDVVKNCRILVGMLPPLEKSPDELQALGKLILSATKSAAAVELPAVPEGKRKEIERPMPAASFGLIMDEYAYINTPGMAVLPAQARGLGIGLTYAGQDYAGFKRASEEEAAQVVGNTNIKIAMKLEDPQTTWELFKDMSGEATVYRSAGFSMQQGSIMTSNYQDNMNVSIERQNRVEFTELKRQIEGEGFLFFGDRITQAALFSHEMKKNDEQTIAIHRFLPMGTAKTDKTADPLVTLATLRRIWSSRNDPDSDLNQRLSPEPDLLCLASMLEEEEERFSMLDFMKSVKIGIRTMADAPLEQEGESRRGESGSGGFGPALFADEKADETESTEDVAGEGGDKAFYDDDEEDASGGSKSAGDSTHEDEGVSVFYVSPAEPTGTVLNKQAVVDSVTALGEASGMTDEELLKGASAIAESLDESIMEYPEPPVPDTRTPEMDRGMAEDEAKLMATIRALAGSLDI